MLLLVSALAACHAPARVSPPQPLVLVVAPNGDDRADGISRPLATLEGARDAIRALRRSQGLPRSGVTVFVRGGTYLRERPLVLGAQDSGTADAPIVYRAMAGETPRILGGRRVKALAQVNDDTVLARLPPEARHAVRMVDLRALGIEEYGSAGGGGLELFADGVAQPLARWPNDGYVEIASVPAIEPIDVRGNNGDQSGRFGYHGDRPARWVGDPDVWLHGFWFWDWSDGRQRVSAIDVEHREIVLAPPQHRYGYRKGQPFYAYNILCELDQPGEWYLDRTRGVLYVWPPGTRELVVSIANQLVVMQGASHVTLRGLALAAVRETAVTITSGTDDAIVDCKILDTGGWGVRIAGGKHHAVIRSEITQTGGGGISIDGGDRATLTPGGHEVVANHIHHCSRWQHTYQPAISVTGVGQRIANNSIHDAPHSAIMFAGNDHTIEGNDIRHVCTETRDAGAIYAGRDWTMRGTVIRNNVFADMGVCHGVYLDDFFSGTEVSGNLFIRIARPVFIGGGRDNVIARNVFVGCAHPIHVDARGLNWAASGLKVLEARLAAMPFREPAWAARYPRLPTIESDQPAAPRGNVFTGNMSLGSGDDEIEPAAAPFIGAPRNQRTFRLRRAGASLVPAPAAR